MRWLGVGLMLGSVVVGLVAWFGFAENKPVTIGAAAFLVIGLIVFFASGYHNQRIENVHTEKK